MPIQRRSKTVSFQYELATPEDSFNKEEPAEQDSAFYSWKRVNKRHHTTTTYLDPVPIDFNNKPIFESYNVELDFEEVAQNVVEVEPEEEGSHILEEEQTIDTSVQDEVDEVTIQEKNILSTPPYLIPELTSKDLLADNTTKITSDQPQDEAYELPDYSIARNNTLAEEETNTISIKEGFPTQRVSLNEIPAVHRPLKDLINKTYKDFYNTDGNKIHIKAGLSKKSVSNLPSLHPTIRRKG